MKELHEYIGTITTKGQVTIPAKVRELLGVKPHDKILFRVTEGRVELLPAPMTLEAAFASVTPRNRPEDFKQIRDEAIEEHVQNVIDKLRD